MPEPRFADLGLPVALVQALRRIGLETAFPIQAAVIPDILAGHDVLGRAATGSGKTLAFGLPMLIRSGAAAPKKPRGLILTPTRELALQIERALDEPALAAGVRLGTAVGGVPIKRQADRLSRGVDLLIATPGRLTDLLGQRAVALDALRVVAVDEADHMAELGFLDQVTALLDRAPADSQHLLFSATLDAAVDTLVERYLRDPVRHSITITTDAAAQPDSSRPDPTEPAIAHHLLHIRKADKRAIVTAIAARAGRTLLFVRTQFAADKLTQRLRASGVAAVALHGGKAQTQRTRALTAFTDGTAPVLVATDVAARGIHVDDISLVVHVDPPIDPKTFLHRAGRTARAGATGMVVTLVTDEERAATEKLMAEAGVAAESSHVRPDDPELAALTGSRNPSGRPVPDPSAPPPATPAARKRGPAKRIHTRRRGHNPSDR
ncbi:DEAD/DEAH box helicase [Nocardia sp. CDC159]|uniref:DEAD/DEAH box helicase n=1 Tax=Nocardia pulmonis TaxID=2951408 RepID=A0A9X2E5Z1_9NOCA|nr:MULTISPECIES: DEAD/DEAH box helicase [Nocardia]MCM6772231.1 DEAD/DEAH box helicase [Nocardia pulmonis]MCM6785111.1 DEAD/DEAH box helicase [Nocardia sp. CDC159]